MAKTIDYFSVATISFKEKNMQDTQLHEVIMSLLSGTSATRVVCNSVHRQSRAFLKLIFFSFQNWMAYEHYPTVWKVKEWSKILFSNYEIPLAQNNYALCKVRILCGNSYW